MRMFSSSPRSAALAVALTSVAAAPASAATIAALQNGTTIVWIDTDQKKTTGAVTLARGASLVGIDVRPADGKVYGLAPDGAIVTVDVKTGAWEKVSQLSEVLPAGVGIAVDFNPVADRMRVIAANGLNLRVNVADGKAIVDGMLKYGPADAAMNRTPMVTAAGYTNSMAGAKETALYDVDTAAGTLLKQAPPNDGVLATVGPLGVALRGGAAFDVWSDGMGANVGWLVSGGALHTVELTTGRATVVGPIAGLTGTITDIAMLPGK
jgi:Domain of unknown function (DUF4394)